MYQLLQSDQRFLLIGIWHLAFMYDFLVLVSLHAPQALFRLTYNSQSHCQCRPNTYVYYFGKCLEQEADHEPIEFKNIQYQYQYLTKNILNTNINSFQKIYWINTNTGKLFNINIFLNVRLFYILTSFDYNYHFQRRTQC